MSGSLDNKCTLEYTTLEYTIGGDNEIHRQRKRNKLLR